MSYDMYILYHISIHENRYYLPKSHFPLKKTTRIVPFLDPDLIQILIDPNIPFLIGFFIKMIDPVSNLALPGELPSPSLELRPQHRVHGGDLLVVTANLFPESQDKVMTTSPEC